MKSAEATTREAPRSPAGGAGSPGSLYGKLSPGPGRPASEVAAHQCARIHSAMVELVAERGYRAVTVRELARLSGVSTRAFYKHFSGKEDCFLDTYESIVRRTAKRIVASQAGECDWHERLRLAFNAFARELEREPRAARLALVDVYMVGPAAAEQICRAERTFGAMIAESFARAPDGVVVPPIVIEGIVAGLAWVVRSRLLAGGGGSSLALGDGLMTWALSYRDESAATLAGANNLAALGSAPAGSARAAASAEGAEPQEPTDDLALMLSAIAKLATNESYEEITIPQIRIAAGVSRRSFDAHFEGVEDCFMAALEHRTGEALSCAADARATAGTWGGGTYLALSALCEKIAQEPLSAKLWFVETFAPGSRGMDCREHLVAKIASLTYGSAPAEQRPNELALEASTAAIWTVLSRRVSGAHTQQLPRLVAALASLALAPAGGAAVAEATQQAQAA